MNANDAPARRAYPKVFINTLNWNGKKDTLECVSSLKKITYPNYEIVIIDNGSHDGSVEAFRAAHPDVTILENGANLGYSLGFNAGLKYSYEHGADYVLVLNNDTVVDPKVIDALVEVAESDARVGFVSGKVYYFDDPTRLQTAGRRNHPIFLVHELVGMGEIDQGQYDEIKDYDYLDDVYVLVSKQAYLDTGGFDANFFLYFEETDWCARIRKAGYRLVYTPHAKIWHKDGRSTGGNQGVNFTYYMARNQILFVRRNAPPGHFRKYLAYIAWRAPRRIAQWLKRGQWNLASAYLRGVGSGLLWVLQN